MSVNNHTFLQNESDDCHNSEYTNGSVEHQLEEHAMIQLLATETCIVFTSLGNLLFLSNLTMRYGAFSTFCGS
jgi:hypothetical protein